MSNAIFDGYVRGGAAIRRGLFGASLLLLVTRCGGGSQPTEAHENIGRTSSPLVSSEWTSAVSMSVARQDHVAALLSGGSVLVAGGHPGNNTPTKAAEVYNPATGTWATVGSMGTARRLFGACTLPSGKVLVAGGNAGAGDVTSAELFDPSANTWSATGALAAAREDFSMTCLSDGRVLVAGGSGPSGLLSSAEVYNPTVGTWSTAGTMPAAVHTQRAVLLQDGRVLIAGGNNASGPVSTAALWSPSTNAWTATGSMATARAFSALNLLADGRVLAAGGLVTLLPLATNTAEIYSPSTGAWSAAASLHSARYSGVSATLAAGPIVIGGVNGGSPLATSESYDSVHNTWTQLTTAYGAVSQTATALSMTSVLVAGGNTGSAATTGAQIYGVLNGFAVYAQRSVTLGSSDHINGGDVGVTSVAPSAFGPQLVVGSSTTVQTNHNLAAPSVSLAAQAQVGDVQTDSLTNAGATLGTQAPYPSSLPAFPLALQAGPGGSSVTVPTLTTTTLNPGNYGALSVTGTVFLNAGNYTFASVTMANQAHFAGVSGTATVSVAGTFQAGNSVSISSPGATPAGQLVISVAGSDSGTTPAFSIGTGAAMSAILSAPHGTLSIGASTIATGAFAGFDVKLGNGVTINYQNGFVGDAAQKGQQQLSGYITPAMAVAPLVGPVPPSTLIALAVSLPVQVPTNFPSLSDYAQQVSDPTSSTYRQFLTPAQYAGHYAPSATSYSTLTALMQANGLSILESYSDNELIDVTGTVGQVEQMVSANLNYYLRSDGTQFFAPDREPSLASPLPVLRVAGLDTFVVPVETTSGSGPHGTFIGNDFRTAYLSGCASSLDGSGQAVALLEEKGFNPPDIVKYSTEAGIADPTPLIFQHTYTATEAPSLQVVDSGEAPMDIEVVHAMAPRAKIVVYQSPIGTWGTVNFVNDMFHAASHTPSGLPMANQISSSIVFDSDDSIGQSLDAMSVQGQSFFQSSGDGGAFTGNPRDIRTNRVTLVGGTILTSFGSGMSPSESAWSQSNAAGSGGFFGPFTFNGKTPIFIGGVRIPGYQIPFVSATNLASSMFRNFPDVSMVAENVARVWTTTSDGPGHDDSSGGTSASTPMWAAFMALANQKASANGVAPVGFATPVLYAIAEPTGSLYGTCFTDVNDGSGNPTNSAGPAWFGNDPDSPPPANGFPAVTGYDLATGLGSPTCTLITQLASATPTVPVPPPPPPSSGASFAGIGPNDTCGMISGAVECWGTNSAGQDGNGTAHPSPGCVTNLTGVVPAVQVVEGSSHSCVLFSDGGVWCWGDNTAGQLGNPTPSSSPTPIVAQSLDAIDMGRPPTQIAAGGNTTCALLSDSTVWCWGSNNQGQLGTGSANAGANLPTLVQSLPPASQVAVSSGGAFVCALLVSGGVDCWGTGYLGNLTLDTNSVPVSTPLTNATSIAVGSSHACAIVAQSAGTPSNKLFCWGDNSESEIGEGDVNTGAFPMQEKTPVVATQVSGCASGCPSPINVTAVALGNKFTCVVIAGGSVKCWGDDTFGQLGNGTQSATPNPNPVAVTGLAGVTQLAAGPGRACALAAGISCWGEGPVGDGSTGAATTPKNATFARCP